MTTCWESVLITSGAWLVGTIIVAYCARSNRMKQTCKQTCCDWCMCEMQNEGQEDTDNTQIHRLKISELEREQELNLNALRQQINDLKRVAAFQRTPREVEITTT